MFRKLVSNLPFSPSLIGQLGFYAKRLQKEEVTRRTGLILTAIALAIQSLVVFSPPESANASNPSDLISGGAHTKSQLLAAWDNNTAGFREIMQYAGVSRANLANTREGRNVEIHSRENGKDAGWRSWGRVARFGAQRGEVAHKIGSMTVYSRPLSNSDTGNNVKGSGSWYDVFLGTNMRGEEFAIIKGCGNLTMRKDPPPVKDITVCRLSDKKYPVTIRESEFDSKLYSKNPEDCKEKPKPIALCSSLSVAKISRSEFNLTAAASTANGATVSSYTFIIKDASGKEVKREIVKSSSLSAVYKYNNSTEGTYFAEVIVSTSVGQQTSAGCKAELVVSPVERCPLNPTLAINDPECQPCPADETLWVKDEKCSAKVLRRKSAQNLHYGKPATEQKAEAGHRIEYQLIAKNEGKATATLDISDNIADVLEYSSLHDAGGGTFNKDSHTITWPKVTLKPGEQQIRTYVVQIASQVSPMPQGASDPTSYDCQITNTFGNTVDIHINCPQPKIIEQTVSSLPKTGPGENMLFGGVIAAIVTYFYFRSRQLNKEVRLIRREAAAGTL